LIVSSKSRSSFPSLPSSARVPRIPSAPPAIARATVAHRVPPSAAVGHLAGNLGLAAVSLAGPPRHHRRPGNHAGTRKPGNPTKNPSPNLPNIT
jgi:hypothetical protein